MQDERHWSDWVKKETRSASPVRRVCDILPDIKARTSLSALRPRLPRPPQVLRCLAVFINHQFYARIGARL